MGWRDLPRPARILSLLVAGVALAAAAYYVTVIWLLVGIFDFRVAPESLTRSSVAAWAGPWDEGAEVTLLMGEASRATGNRWQYRAITDASALATPGAEFGYYKTLFERITTLQANGPCFVDGHPRGREITLAVDGETIASRRYCRLSALDFKALWERGEAVGLYDEALPRAAHRAEAARLMADPGARVISRQADYQPYDATLSVALPTLWQAPAPPGEHDLDLAVEAAFTEALRAIDPSEGWRLRIADRAETELPLRALSRDPLVDMPEHFRRYLIAGPEGLRAMTALDLGRFDVTIWCAEALCARLEALDTAALIAPWRDPAALIAAYEAGPPAQAGEGERRLDLAELLSETLGDMIRTPLTYRLRWVEMSQPD